jgi:hypothetical protein
MGALKISALPTALLNLKQMHYLLFEFDAEALSHRICCRDVQWAQQRRERKTYATVRSDSNKKIRGVLGATSFCCVPCWFRLFFVAAQPLLQVRAWEHGTAISGRATRRLEKSMPSAPSRQAKRMEKQVNSCNTRILILLSKEKSANPIKAGKEKKVKNEVLIIHENYPRIRKLSLAWECSSLLQNGPAVAQ